VREPTSAIALHSRGDMSSRFTIVVEGIDDSAIVADIDKTIRASFHEMALPGAWHVRVRPSRVSGRWDFSLHGLDVRHTLAIAVPPNLLSSLIPRRLRESLDRCVFKHEPFDDPPQGHRNIAAPSPVRTL
jgi:hypothetical protein